MMIDVSKEPFATLLQRTVLGPIGMTHSTYEQPLPEAMRGDFAMPYKIDGTAVPGGPHTYPEQAAAGLWTTPGDLLKYVMEVQGSLAGKSNHVLSQKMTAEMLRPGMGQWGLGVEVGGSAARPYFSHGGVNEGYEGLFVGYEQGGDGAVIMTNARGGMRLANELMRSIAVEYGWPDFQPVVRRMVTVDPTVLQKYVGEYAPAPHFKYTITLDHGQLMTQASGQKAYPLFPESKTKFFLTVVDAEVEFVSNDKGEVTGLILYQGGHEYKAPKTK